MAEGLKLWVEIIYKITLIVGIFVGVGMYFFRLHKRKKQEEILVQIGKLRAEGVAIRNEGTKPIQGTELENWIKKVDDITVKIENAVNKFDPVLGEVLRILDTYPLEKLIEDAPANEYGSDQLRRRNILSEKLKRVKDMIDKYYAPKSYRSERG